MPFSDLSIFAIVENIDLSINTNTNAGHNDNDVFDKHHEDDSDVFDKHPSEQKAAKLPSCRARQRRQSCKKPKLKTFVKMNNKMYLYEE